MSPKRDLELHEDMLHQRREWRAERVGWVVMALALVGALLGLFGTGPISERTREAGTGFRIEYERILRYQAPSEVRIHFPPPAGEGDVRIAMNRDFFDAMEITSAPEAHRVDILADRVLFHFRVRADAGISAVNFRVEPTRRWGRKATVTLNETHTASFRVFILP